MVREAEEKDQRQDRIDATTPSRDDENKVTPELSWSSSSKRRPSKETRFLPEWLEDDDDSDSDDADLINQDRKVGTKPSLHFSERGDLSPLEGLAPDLSAHVLLHLNVQEIASIATVSRAIHQAGRNPNLWKLKFQARWNYPCSMDDEEEMDWFFSYQQAYQNPHDLWITHWNCVDPYDGLGPGRCCIHLSDSGSNRSQDKENTTASREKTCSHLCPTCRYQHSLSGAIATPTTICTPAQAVATATSLRLMQHSALLSNVNQYCPRRARRAFFKSSTLHRTLSTDQYTSHSLCFLSDLLFFQVHDDEREFEELKHQFPSFTTERHPHDASCTAMHSWHMVHFSNPDYNRPLVWRISIQRPDCFTVYPSEGILRPGESKVIVFGVKTLASLLSHATQQLNAHREGVDEFWGNVYTEEAHLPATPFLIHYHYASVIPCRRAEDDTNPYHDLNHQQPHESHRSINDSHSPWQRAAQPQQPVRTMYLSAHVNANYSLTEFRRSTLIPYSVRDHRLVVFCAPQLMEKYPNVWEQLEHLELEKSDSIQAQAYRTESACEICGHTWGVRSEELAQAYVLTRIECEWNRRKSNKRFQRMHFLLTQLSTNQDSWTKRHYQLCYTTHNMLVDHRGSPWLTQCQKDILLRWEIFIDDLCRLHNNEGSLIPWRDAGVYKHDLCTDSVFSGTDEKKQSLLDEDLTMPWKEEPRYLEAFSHLAHSPGRFCLGPQEDPNHSQQQRHSRFSRRQRGFVTDMFMDDPICGLESALCVVLDPRSLMVHGIYDRVPYPGTLVRRPKLPVLPPIRRIARTADIRLKRFISSPKKLNYYQVQNALDIASLLLVDSWCISPSSYKSPACSFSLLNYIFNIPAPGAGRFALCTCASHAPREDEVETTTSIEELFVENDFLEGTTSLSRGSDADPTDENDGAEEESVNGNMNNFRADLDNLHLPPIHARGPRFMNLLWVLSAHLGWTADDNQGAASVFVDRRILIGAQWLSISLMAAPLFWTLLARYEGWIPATPVDYPLQALPYTVENELRYAIASHLKFVFSTVCNKRNVLCYTDF